MAASSGEPRVDKDALAGFVPKTVKFFAAEYPESQPYKAPMRMPFQTVTLFADISGFTVTSVALSKFGSYGAEALADCLNQYMTLMIREVLSAGGDIIKFAGDAMIAIWPHLPEDLAPAAPILPDKDLYQTSESYRAKLEQKLGREVDESEFDDEERWEDMKEQLEAYWQDEKMRKLSLQKRKLPKLCHRVVQCCCRIQDRFDLFDQKYIDVDVRLQVKLGVGCGRVDLLHLGGVFNRLEFLVCGEGLQQAFRCEADASATKTIVSPEVMNYLNEVEANPTAYSVGSVGNWEVTHVEPTSRKVFDKVPMTPKALKRVADYVPKSVLPHLCILGSEKWANELRECTILFVSLDYDLKNFNGDDDGSSLKEVHEIIQTIQTSIYAFEGSLNKFLSDDKGSTLVAVFGLFPVSHEDDKARAVLAALRLKNDLDSLNRQCWIGITSGMVFSGLCGHKKRQREFSVIGVYVNLAARLMAEAKKWKRNYKNFKGSAPAILVSETVKKAAEGEPRLNFKTLQGVKSVKCKGFAERIRVFKPKFLANHKGRAEIQPDGNRIEVISHFEKDIRHVKNRIMDMRRDGEGAVLLVEGGAGLGVDQFKRRLKAEIGAGLGVTKWAFISGAGDPFDIYPENSSTPVWSSVFENLREIKGYQLGDRQLLQKFKEYVEMRRPDLVRYICLVANTLKFPLGRDERFFKGMTAQQELICGLDLLSLFLEMIAYTQPIVVMIYKAQHLKCWDWHLTRRLASLIHHNVVSNVTLIVSCTPIDNQCYTPLYPDEKLVPQYKAFKARLVEPDMIVRPQVWTLANTREYIQSWITAMMGFRGEKLEVCDLIVNTVHERCGGRPDFCEMFLKSLHEQDLFVKDRVSKTVMFKPDTEERLHHDEGIPFIVPDRIKCLTLTHFDRISVEKQMVLKIASVLCVGQGVGCLVFDREMLEDVHPISQYVQRIDSDMSKLVELGYIHEVPTANNFGDDPPLLGGSPLFDYTEIMPDVEYLKLADLQAPFKVGKMKKLRAGENFGEGRLFAFKHDVLYWWAPNDNRKKPRGSIRFDSRIITRPEARNPQLVYAVGVSMNTSKRHIKVKTNKKVYELRPSNTTICQEWYNLFQDALNKPVVDNDNFSQTRPRVETSLSETVNSKRSSVLSLKQFNEVYPVSIIFSEDLQNKFEIGVSKVTYDLFPTRTTPGDIIQHLIETYLPEENVKDYILVVEGSEWPLYGTKHKIWENNHVRLACIENPEPPFFYLYHSDESSRYSRTTGAEQNSSHPPIIVKIKLPPNAHHLLDHKQKVDFNETTVESIIKSSLSQLSRGKGQPDESSQNLPTEHFSEDPSDWMLRLVGSDVHLFGNGLLAEFEAVREVYDQSSRLTFQLLKIKPAARKAMEQGKGHMIIYRFYAFSYGFMRDNVYRQMLHPHRVDLHGQCTKHLQYKLKGADRGSALHILMHRHEQISQKPITV